MARCYAPPPPCIGSLVTAAFSHCCVSLFPMGKQPSKGKATKKQKVDDKALALLMMPATSPNMECSFSLAGSLDDLNHGATGPKLRQCAVGFFVNGDVEGLSRPKRCCHGTRHKKTLGAAPHANLDHHQQLC